jgi:AcrR family transcriptional regulator
MLDAIDALLATSQTRMTPQDFLRATTGENFDSYVDGADWLQFFVTLLALNSPAVGASLADYFDTVTTQYSTAYARALEHLGYEVRPPFTIRQFTVATMCLADGMQARRIADPTITRDFYVDLIEHLATSMLVRQGSSPEPMTPLDLPMRGKAIPPTRTEIVDAAMRLFARERLGMPTTQELADAAGCSERTVETHVGGVAGAIRAAWEEWAPWFDESVEHDRRTMRDPDPLSLLYRLAIRVATRAAENRALTRALLMLDLSGTAGRAHRPDPLGAMFERLLLEAAARKHFVAPTASGLPFDAERVGVFAMVLRSNVLNMVLSAPVAPDNSPHQHAKACVDYVWASLMPPRRDGSDAADDHDPS